MKLTVTVPVQETREIELTEKYYKTEDGSMFFRINEDTTVTSIDIYKHYPCIISAKTLSIFGQFYGSKVLPSTEQEFQEAFTIALTRLNLA